MELNTPVCAKRYGNTGYGDCWFDPKKIKGAIQVPADFVLTASDLLDLQSFLQEKTMAPIGQRIFMYHNFVGITDNTEDVQIETMDYGNKEVTRDGDYDITFRRRVGGVSLHQETQKNAGNGKYFLFYDENGVIFGYKTKAGITGIPDVLFYVGPWRMATGSTSAMYNLRFIFSPIYINNGNLGFVQVDGFNIFDIKGLQDVDMTLVSLVGNVATVLLKTKISGVNLFTTYASNLAQTAAYKILNEQGGTVPLTAVTQHANAQGNEGGFDLTMDNAAFNASDKVYVKLIEADELAEAPVLVVGYDQSEPLEIEAPGS